MTLSMRLYAHHTRSDGQSLHALMCVSHHIHNMYSVMYAHPVQHEFCQVITGCPIEQHFA